MYPNPALQSGVVTASAVWGQNDFTSHGCNKGGSPDATTVCLGGVSIGVDVDSHGNLWVADALNNRVLRFPYDSETGTASTVADLVLGQADFSGNGSGQGLDQLNLPGAVRVDSSDNVFIADTYNHRILEYAGPLTPADSGEAGVIWGSGFGDYPSSGGPGPTGIEFDIGTNGTPTGNIWVNNYNGNGVGSNRVELWDAAGENVLKVLYTDVYPNVWGDGTTCGTGSLPEGNNEKDSCYQGDSRGSIGITDHGDLFITGSSNNQQVLHFEAPIPFPIPGQYIAADYKLYQDPDTVNWLTKSSMSGPMGLAVYDSGGTHQLIVADGWRILFWNDPMSAASGAPADGIVGASDQSGLEKSGNDNNYGRIATDKAGHLYVAHKNGGPNIEIFDLPLTANETPSITIEADNLKDLEGDTVGGGGGDDLGAGGLYPSADGSYLWIAQPSVNRVVRIRNPLTNPKVDIVLGQPDASSTTANQGLGSPTLSTLYLPGSVVLDNYNNVYVSDSALEANGNGRMLEFDASTTTNSSNTTTLFDPAADKTVIPIGYQPFQPAFNSNNNMVVGYNSYAHSATNHSIDYFTDIRNNQTPAGSFNDYYSMPYSMVFDSSNNLYVSDIARTKVMVYLSPLADLFGSTPYPTPTPTETPPTVILNSPSDGAVGQSNNPTLNFTGTDPQSDAEEYQVNIYNNSAIVLDNKSSSNVSCSDTLAWSHTVNTDDNTYLVVGVATRNGRTVSSVTYGSQSLTQAAYHQNGGDARSEIWTLADPTVGTHTVTVTISAVDTFEAGAVSYTGVSDVGNTAGNGGGFTTNSTISISSNTSNLVVDTLAVQSANESLTVSDGQTQEVNEVGDAGADGMSDKPGESTTTMGWTVDSDIWEETAVELVAATITSIDRFSTTNAGFADVTNSGDTHPFASGNNINFTVQVGDTLSSGTYHWRVRAIDPSGSNTYGAWSSVWTFTATSSATPTPTPTPSPTPTQGNSGSGNNPGAPGPSVCSDSVGTGTPDLFEITTTNTSATLYFAPPNPPYSSFYVEYSRDPNTWEYGTTFPQSYSSGVLQYTISMLAPNTKYYFSIRSGNGCATGAWSNTMSATTTSSSAKGISTFFENGPTSAAAANTQTSGVQTSPRPLPITGTGWPSLLGAGLGTLVIIGSILLAL
jgi:hypothetical protein